MKTLDEIAIHFGTDKATVHKTGSHGYTPHYDKAFESFREKPAKFLEIGVGGGESIQTWLEYFTHPRSYIYGVDTNHSTNPWNTPKATTHERYTFCQGDQSHDVFWKCFIADYGSDWDIVMDDGGHFSNQIITSFNELWPKVKSGGLYCIEDLGVAYGAGSIFVSAGFPNHIDWLRHKIDQMNSTNSDIDSITFARELAILRKK
jgi:demethylmacrocin O-methyltransferase